MKTVLLLITLFITPWEDQLRRDRPPARTTPQTRATAGEARNRTYSNDSQLDRQRRGESYMPPIRYPETGRYNEYPEPKERDSFMTPLQPSSLKRNAALPNSIRTRYLFNQDGKPAGRIESRDSVTTFFDADGDELYQFHIPD